MNKYAKGAEFEREVARELKKHGYLSYRSAGSKGTAKVDIVAIPPIDPDHRIPVVTPDKTLLVQCKTSGKISKLERKKIVEAAEKYGCMPVLASKGEKEDSEIKFEVVKV